MEEIWKKSEGQYEVSNLGRLRRNCRLIRTRLDRYGYEIATLWVDGKQLTRKIHRLVAIAFIENPNNLETVNHIDGIKLNNNVNNLEWRSVADNHRHAFDVGLHVVGEHRTAGRPVKLKEEDVHKIRELIKSGLGNTEIGRRFKVSCGCIYSIRIGKSWTHI